MNGTIYNTDAILFVFYFVIIALFVAWPYNDDKRRLGNRLARRLAPRSITRSVIMLTIIFVFSRSRSQLNSAIIDVAVAIFLLAIGALSLAKGLLHRKGPASIYDFGVIDNDPRNAGVIFLIFTLIALLSPLLFQDREHQSTWMALSVGCLFLSIAGFLLAKVHTLITADGIYAAGARYTWDRIKWYALSDNKGEMITLVLLLTGRIPPYDFVEIKIPAQQRELVGQVLTDHELTKL